MRRLRARSVRELFSPLVYDELHVLQYLMSFPECSHLDTGVVTISVDVDVGDENVGLVNEGRNDINVSSTMTEYQVGFIERNTLPPILELLKAFEIPVTFAIRGQLLDVAPSIIENINNSSIEHDIGGHGYYHRDIAAMTAQQADYEFSLLNNAMRGVGLRPKSFIFPRGRIAHLETLARFGYICFRSPGGFPHNRMRVDRVSGVWRLHSTLMIHGRTHVASVKKILDICSEKRTFAHLWFHPWNFGPHKSNLSGGLENVMKPLLAHIRALEKDRNVIVNTMKTLAELLERGRSSHS